MIAARKLEIGNLELPTAQLPDSDLHCHLVPIECVDGEYCNMEIYEVTDHTWYNNATLMEFACQAGAQIIVVGLDSRDSYDNIRRYAGFILQNGPPIGTPLIIIANKSDLTGTDSCQITKEDLAREAASWHCDDCTLLEASAKDNFNVEEAFITAVRLGREAKRVREERRARARKEGCCIQ